MAPHPPTFLFADLVGFTALTARRGDRDAADVAVGFTEAVRSAAQRHDAEVIKAIGDAVMVRASHPAGAIALGEHIAAELPALYALPEVRVGMHTGHAVERDGDWYGATVNLASRLADVAGPGEVLVSDTTRSLAGLADDRRLRRRGRFAFRRRSGRLAVYAVDGREKLPRVPSRRCLRARARAAGMLPAWRGLQSPPPVRKTHPV
jgi:class 3 adenylate cyclase